MKRALVFVVLLFSLALAGQTGGQDAKKAVKKPVPPPADPNAPVWVNTQTNVYHCMSAKGFKKTDKGMEMKQSEAQAKNFKPAHGKPCPR